MADPLVSPGTTQEKVWIVTQEQYPESYSENFKGETLTIPPYGKKQVLRPIIEASKFLSSPQGDRVKPLKMLRLTVEEKREYDPASLGDRSEQDKAIGKKVAINARKIPTAELAKEE